MKNGLKNMSNEAKYTLAQLKVYQEVCDWYTDNRWMFKTDEIYGIDIIADLQRLVLSCIEIDREN